MPRKKKEMADSTPATTVKPGQRIHSNGATPKTVLTDGGALDLSIPRDREGSFLGGCEWA